MTTTNHHSEIPAPAAVPTDISDFDSLLEEGDFIDAVLPIFRHHAAYIRQAFATERAARDQAETELGYIKAQLGAVGTETAYEAVKRFMRGARERDQAAEKNQRIVDLVAAPGTRIEASKINRGQVVVVDGRTGLDAVGATALDAIDELFDEADGGESPERISLTFRP